MEFYTAVQHQYNSISSDVQSVFKEISRRMNAMLTAAKPYVPHQNAHTKGTSLGKGASWLIMDYAHSV